MKSDIEHLLGEAEAYDAESPEYDAWSNTAVISFSITPRISLEHYEIVRFDYPSSPGHEFRLKARREIGGETTALVNQAWRATGGTEEPRRGLEALATASEEIVRAQLDTVLWMAARLRIYRTHRPAAAQEFSERVLAIDWHDANAVLRANFHVLSHVGVAESIANNLYNWTARIDRSSGKSAFLGRSPAQGTAMIPTQEALMAAAALLWIDAAASIDHSLHSQEFMACAANAMWEAGSVGGWEAKEGMLRADAQSAGKRGGAERHRASRELKQWALVEAASMRGADMEIARELAKRVPTRLSEASADPKRLIYESLRAAAADRRTKAAGE